MIKFLGSITADEQMYSTVAKRGMEKIKSFENVFQGVNCPNHPFHNIVVLLSFSDIEVDKIEIKNSCCKTFTNIFEEMINEHNL